MFSHDLDILRVISQVELLRVVILQDSIYLNTSSCKP